MIQLYLATHGYLRALPLCTVFARKIIIMLWWNVLESCWSPLHSRISLKKDGTQGSVLKFRNLSQHCKQHLHHFTDSWTTTNTLTIWSYWWKKRYGMFCPGMFALDVFALNLLPHRSPKYMSVSLICMWAKSFQACLTLCDPMNCSPPGSSVHGILQARILEQVAMPSSRRSSQHKDQIHVSYISCIGR